MHKTAAVSSPTFTLLQIIRRKVDVEATVCPQLDSDSKCELQEKVPHVPTPLNKQWSESSCGTDEEKEECDGCEEEGIYANSEVIELEPTPTKVALYEKFLQGKEVLYI